MALLTTDQFTAFRKLVLECFPGNDLAELTRTALDVRLGDIVGIEGQERLAIVSDLIWWVEARGLTQKLIEVVRSERPGRSDVQTICAGLLSPGAGPPPLDANGVRVRVIEFRAAFTSRQQWFDRLNAYKRLHEVLHNLLDRQPEIDEAVQQFRGDPTRSLRLERFADALEDELLDEATRANAGTEFPEEAEKWIDSFRKAVDILRKARTSRDVAALGRAVAALQALPHQQQSGLDRELIRCALRLRTEELAAMMDEILAVPQSLAAVEALRAGLSRFRELCRPLGGLTTDHNLCQDIETELAAVPAEDAMRERVEKWPDMLAGLLRLAGRRPDDRMAERMARYARAFDTATEAASASDQFTLLRDQFGRLFSKTDKDLLAVTDGLVREAALLNALLRGFT